MAPFAKPQTGAQPTLMIDNLCVQFEDTPGIVRFLFDPHFSGESLLDVHFLFENQLSGERVAVRPIRFLDRPRELPVAFPAQVAGAAAWSVTVEYECAGRRYVLDGDIQILVVHPREAQKVAENLAINITNTINNGNASDVHVNQRAADELSKLSSAENPFDELRRVILGPSRAWDIVDLFSADETEALPPMPQNARTERLVLDLGVRRITFFAGRSVTFGRKKETNDIALRPQPDATEEDMTPYMRISRAHCHFEHQGEKVVICDGQRDAFRIVQPSACGTYWNDVRIAGTHMLSAGDEGVVSFGEAASAGAVALDVKVCTTSSSSLCARCPYADKLWCGGGTRPALMMTRRDGVPERFVAVWSCFRLSEADPSFEGVVIFRKDGAFAWRKGRRCGWIVPGTKQQTDFGVVTVS
jgi:pSer/pThr/pTyr-binding forkhead associated (FHA) protein